MQNSSLKDIKLSECTLHDYVIALMSAESDTLREVAFNEFFGTTERSTSDSETLSDYQHRKIQYIWKEFFDTNGYTLVKEVSFGYLNQQPPTMMEIETSPDVFIRAYKEATVFYENKKTKEKLVMEVTAGHNGGFFYTIHSSDKKSNVYQGLTKLADEKNLYKGKKIDCDCRFLKLDNLSWDDVILSDGVTDVIKANVNDLFDMRDAFKRFNLPVKRGIILYGPPGTGKTQVCRCLAKDANFSVLYALPTDFASNRGGVRKVCHMAKDLAPCLLIVEDIDWIAQNRHQGNAGFVMELMNQLDGIESFGDVITLGTTNCLEELEDAVKNRPGRFDRLIKIDKPDEKGREKMIRQFTRNFILDPKVRVKKLAESLEGLTGAHIKDLCTTTAMFAVRASSIEGDKLLLKKQHFDEAIKEVKHKDYSSYAQLQGKGKGFGFTQSSGNSLEEFLGAEPDSINPEDL